jgi:dipeptidyl aminopeptidase/acylaminoacyl peptidase
VQTLGDYGRAVDYLVSRPDVDPEQIGYAGISLGAITGITFVAHEPRVRAMASVVGGANLLGAKVVWGEDVRRMAERVDPFFHVGRIAPRPLLLLNAKRDQLVPRFFGEELHRAADGGHVKKVWMDTDHFFRGVDRLEVMETVIGFMEHGLAAPPPPPE